MSKQDFEIRFDKARARLNSALKELEKTTTDKIYETASQSRMLPISGDENSLSSKVNEQFSTIQNLSAEINKLQENLAALGGENDALIEENASLSQNLNKFHTHGSSLVNAIESDLAHIEEIISGEKNG